MDFKKMLTRRTCSCGMEHDCDIREVLIEKGAIEKTGELAKEYRRILLVADKNTYGVCGDSVAKQLGEKVANTLIYEDDLLVPDEVAIEKLRESLDKETDLIVGVGSGVIQDLCKYVSFYEKLPYFIVATAPSMDGYASKGAAMITNRMKITYATHVPEVIIGDTDILKDAPLEMIKSGYGDILGKYSCLNDWKLAHAVNDEYFCGYVYDLVEEMLLKTKDLGPRLLAREEEAIQTLTEALIGVGIAIAYVGNSRPASGSEHHLSHFFEIVGIVKDEPYFMHGTDVAYSAVCTQRMREEILKVSEPSLGIEHNPQKWEEEIRRIYGIAAEGVIDLQKELGWYSEDKMAVYKERWQKVLDVLADTPSSKMLEEYLESIGLPFSNFEEMYGEKKIEDALWFAKDLKDRYSVLWLYYMLFYKGEKR